MAGEGKAYGASFGAEGSAPVTACVTDLVAPPLRRLLTEVNERSLAGRRIVLHHDGWQFAE